MQSVFIDAFLDTAKMVPLLLVIYIGIEVVEYRFGNKIRTLIQKAGLAGPFVGSIAGIFPQCGLSVVTTALYTQRLVTIGTLLAVYLSTSDEAIPVILSQPDKAGIIIPLILTKVIIAIIAGYIIDFVFRSKNKAVLIHLNAYAQGQDEKGHNHNPSLNEQACCGHSVSQETGKFNLKEVFLHPILHTLKIFLFIFIITFLLNGIMFKIGADTIAIFLSGHVLLQPFFAALIGLIPNCASSVALAELYLNGAITYGAVIAGLCASGGLGILVLFKEEKSKKEAFKIIGLLFFISVIAGLLIQYLS
ncbi:MAG: putative manganese transporter [Candidatus Paceibacterota bacterium]|jgi:hypothetical protein